MPLVRKGVLFDPNPKVSKWWTYGWLGWIGWFAAEETAALVKTGRAGTLSEHIWRWFGIPQHRAPKPALRARRFAMTALLAWLIMHFFSGGEY